MLHPEYVADLEGQLSYVVETWREVKPLMHISEQKEGARIGAHSDYIETIPSYLFDLVKDGVSLDIEVEAKMKEQAIFQLYKKYPHLVQQ
jgi:UV DNA damage endonuclease